MGSTLAQAIQVIISEIGLYSSIGSETAGLQCQISLKGLFSSSAIQEVSKSQSKSNDIILLLFLFMPFEISFSILNHT